MADISQISGFEILDSRGNPTVAARVVLSDRVAKYNRLLLIEDELRGYAVYAGRSAFRA